MKDKFNISNTLRSVVGYKGTPYTGITDLVTALNKNQQSSGIEYTLNDTPRYVRKELSELGSRLRKMDAQGRWYFMPVVLIDSNKKEYEVPNASISFTGKKTIVETAMTGRRGTVKELINMQDYEITINGVYTDDDFPDVPLDALNKLYCLNEALELNCALTDIFLGKDNARVVIRSMDVTPIRGTENMHQVKMGLVTDKNFELVIE